MSAVDPADVRAQARAELGLSRELAQPRRVMPHPRKGGSSGYPVWSREEQLEKWNAGEETGASEASLYRWSDRLMPHRCTGNRARTQIVGTDLINLVVLLFAHPDATIDEMAAHIYNEGGSYIQVNKSPSASRSWISRQKSLLLRPIRHRLRRFSTASSASGSDHPPWHLSGATEDAHQC